MRLDMKNGDGTGRACSFGASVCYPVGTIRRVKVGDALCRECPSNKRADNEEGVDCVCPLNG